MWAKTLTSDGRVGVSFGECNSGASSKISLGASDCGDGGRIGWNRAVIVRAHREPAISGQALCAVFFPTAPLVRGAPNLG